MPHRFFYLRGAVGSEGLLEEQQASISGLLTGNYTTSNLERLKGRRGVYSLRLGEAARLLFTIISLRGEKYLLVLDYLPTHDYHKSRFLKSRVLEDYREKVGESEHPPIYEAINEEELALITTPIEETLVESGEPPVVVDYFRRLFITLNAEQEAVLSIGCPSGIRGGAGTGKTVTALSTLAAFVDTSSFDGAPRQRLIYVTTSERLVEEMKKSWELLPQAVDCRHEVLFKSMANLIHEEPMYAHARLVGQEEFSKWYISYLKQDQQIAKTTGFVSNALDNSLTAYQECRTCSGYTQENYEHLGERQSLIDQGKREWMYKAYLSYQTFLNQSGVIDPSFIRFKETRDSYDLVLVDEAQDMSLGQLLGLSHLAKDRQFMVWMDDNQRLQDELSMFARACELLHIPEQNQVTLHGSYRCPPQIMALANQVRLLRDYVAQGTLGKEADKKETVSMRAPQEGSSYLIDNSTLMALPWLEAAASGTEFAIITQERHIQTCRDHFKTPLVFTPTTIKGLEYRVILTWNLYPREVFAALKKRDDALRSEGAKQPKHQGPRGVHETQFNRDLNALYTAYTRATEMLLICEEPSLENKCLLERLAPLVDTGSPQLEVASEASSQEAWLQQVEQQLDLGNELMAEEIFKARISVQSREFERFVALYSKAQKGCFSSAASVQEDLSKKSPTERPETLPSSPAPKQQKEKTKKAPLPPPKSSSSASSSSTAQTQEMGTIQHLCAVAKSLKENFFGTLYQAGANLNELTKSRAIQLIMAAQDGHLQTVRELLDKGADVNQATNEGVTPLLIAAKEGHFEIVRVLLKKEGIAINQVTNQGVTPLIMAAQEGHHTVVEALLNKGADFNQATNQGVTPLIIAVKDGHLKIVKLLLNKGADFNKANNEGDTPLIIAAVEGHLKIVEVLLKKGADFNQANNQGATPLFMAAYTGHFRVVCALLGKEGIALNQANNQGATPLFMAAQEGHLEIVDALLDKGADCNQATNQGVTPLISAALKGRLKIVEALLNKGADFNRANNDGATPLFMAVVNGHLEVVRALLGKEGIALNQAIIDGVTPLLIAAYNGHLEVVHALLGKEGIAINQATNQGVTPLIMAAQGGHLEIVEALLNKGADFNQANNQGVTPPLMAAQEGHLETVDGLLENDADFNKGPKSLFEKLGFFKSEEELFSTEGSPGCVIS